MFKLSKNNISIILTIITVSFIVVTAVLAMLYFIPAKSVVTDIQPLTVQKSQPVKITSFDIDLSYEGNQDDFEYLLDNQSDPASITLLLMKMIKTLMFHTTTLTTMMKIKLLIIYCTIHIMLVKIITATTIIPPSKSPLIILTYLVNT